jgi:hypothetical protein
VSNEQPANLEGLLQSNPFVSSILNELAYDIEKRASRASELLVSEIFAKEKLEILEALKKDQEESLPSKFNEPPSSAPRAPDIACLSSAGQCHFIS